MGVLLIASPVIGDIVHFPEGEQFSEIFLLGPEKMAQDIPFNIVPGQNYSVYLGVGNYMGEATYYVCKVKLRNQTELSPNSDTQTASPLQTLYEYHYVIKNGENCTEPLTFSISAVSQDENMVVLQSITINNVDFNVDKIAQYDPDNDGYYYQLFVELWAYNSASEVTQYQNRWVFFWFKIASP